jgi:hypothetical protein
LEYPTETYYAELKRLARERVKESIERKFDQGADQLNWRMMELASIDSESIAYASSEWRRFYSEDTHSGFDIGWERLYHKFRCNPAFFDLAIWQIIDGKRVLQVMALGKPNRGKRYISLHWIERSFAPTFMQRALLVSLACLEEYARLLRVNNVRIKDPVDARKYQRYGYVLVKVPQSKSVWMRKELGK